MNLKNPLDSRSANKVPYVNNNRAFFYLKVNIEKSAEPSFKIGKYKNENTHK
jgi:hypothetical protein